MSNQTKLAVIVHADVVGSTALVHIDERTAHIRMQEAFHRLSDTIQTYNGRTRELRGDALVAEFDLASDALSAALAFQCANADWVETLEDEVRPVVRVGIALGEVVIADNTVTGPGVVLAQRLEQLARPGEVTIQGAVHDSVPRRLPFEYEDLGDQVLKGFDNPVRAYVAKLSSGASVPAADVPDAGAMTPSRFTRAADARRGKPAITVLGFENRSNDTQQQFFADGLAEDISGALSRLRWLTVVSVVQGPDGRRALSDRQTVLDLDVDFTLRGSVRRAGDRLRVTVFLERADSGEQIWSERYDRSVAELFDLEDDICAVVLARLESELGAAEQRRVRGRPPATLSAWEAYQCGLAERQGVVGLPLHSAKAYFEQAVVLDPEFSAAKAALALTHCFELGWGLVPQSERRGREEQALELAEAAIRVDPREAMGFVARSRVRGLQGDNLAAMNDAQTALERNPNSSAALVMRATAKVFGSTPEEAMADVELAIRLSPLDPYIASMRYTIAALSRLRQGLYEEAVRWGEAGMQTMQSPTWSCALVAIASAQIGQGARARDAVAQLMSRRPDFTISSMLGRRRVGDDDFHAWFVDQLKGVGIPE